MADIKTTIDRSKNLSIHTFIGKVTAGEILAYIQRIYPSGNAVEKTLKNTIWDFTRAKGADMPGTELMNLAHERQKFDKFREGGKTAMVFSRDVGYGLGRIYETHATFGGSSKKYKIFYSIEDALKWVEE